MINFKTIAMKLPINQYQQSVRIYASETGMPLIGSFYWGLKQASASGIAIERHWEGHRSSVREILMSQIALASVLFDGSHLTGGPTLEGSDPEILFRARLDFEKALWDLVSGMNVIDPASRRPETEPVKYIRVDKNGPVVRLTRGIYGETSQFMFTSNDSGGGSSLDVSMLSLNSWLQIQEWAKGEETRALAAMSNFVNAYPFAILFEDPSKKESMTLSRFAAFWSTHPKERFDQLSQLLARKTLPQGVIKEPFWQALIGEHKTPAELNFFQLRNPVLVWLGIK